MPENKNPSQVAGTTSEETVGEIHLHVNAKSAFHESQIRVQSVVESNENPRKVIEATKTLSSDQISKLDNAQIALRIYFLIANGSEKTTDDFCEIGSNIHSFAIQLSR